MFSVLNFYPLPIFGFLGRNVLFCSFSIHLRLKSRQRACFLEDNFSKPVKKLTQIHIRNILLVVLFLKLPPGSVPICWTGLALSHLKKKTFGLKATVENPRGSVEKLSPKESVEGVPTAHTAPRIFNN